MIVNEESYAVTVLPCSIIHQTTNVVTSLLSCGIPLLIHSLGATSSDTSLPCHINSTSTSFQEFSSALFSMLK